MDESDAVKFLNMIDTICQCGLIWTKESTCREMVKDQGLHLGECMYPKPFAHNTPKKLSRSLFTYMING